MADGEVNGEKPTKMGAKTLARCWGTNKTCRSSAPKIEHETHRWIRNLWSTCRNMAGTCCSWLTQSFLHSKKPKGLRFWGVSPCGCGWLLWDGLRSFLRIGNHPPKAKTCRKRHALGVTTMLSTVDCDTFNSLLWTSHRHFWPKVWSLSLWGLSPSDGAMCQCPSSSFPAGLFSLLRSTRGPG